MKRPTGDGPGRSPHLTTPSSLTWTRLSPAATTRSAKLLWSLYSATRTHHTTLAGATLNAESVVAGLKALPHDPVADFFSAKGQPVKAFVQSPQ